ncbi:hypothetical protein EYF80_013522 [Liparis tanakae]|uniref:Uncharacterized protein n=1 Tax=Liparis tanakae TaxID=230148 RepID=A0A4Z2IFP0_9TELE|nr:hypothetical protein EYF80_013522 [Liparis tanakae]
MATLKRTMDDCEADDNDHGSRRFAVEMAVLLKEEKTMESHYRFCFLPDVIEVFLQTERRSRRSTSGPRFALDSMRGEDEAEGNKERKWRWKSEEGKKEQDERERCGRQAFFLPTKHLLH